MDRSCQHSGALLPESAFVVQLREGTSFEAGELCGRIEHVSSGRAIRFESLEQAAEFMELVLKQHQESSPRL